jgi:hypothetical protein
MTEKDFIPVERAINQAKRMKLRSKEQLEIVGSLIYHIDMLSITVRNQRRQLESLNRKCNPPNIANRPPSAPLPNIQTGS